MNNSPKQLLRVPEAAAFLNLSQKTIWAMVYARTVEVVRIGHSVRIPANALQDLIERGTTRAVNPR